VESFKRQQFRWAKGSFQVVRKILPEVLGGGSKLPVKVRLMALLHLTGYFVHPLMLGLLLLTLPAGLLNPGLFRIVPISVVAGLGPPLLYALAEAPETYRLGDRLKLLPLLLLMGFGISLSTSIGVLEGLLGRGGVFVRTPKLNLGDGPGSSKPIDGDYLPPLGRLVWAEIGLGFYALLTMLILVPHVGWGIIPWMTIYMLGYFYIAGLNLLQHWQAAHDASPGRKGRRLIAGPERLKGTR
jgi:hypothetical protein